MAEWPECYEKHYTHFLGIPAHTSSYEQPGTQPRIQILGYDRFFHDDTAMTFCSNGLSLYAHKVGLVSEVYLPLDGTQWDPNWPEIPYLLASALFYMIQKPMTLGWGIAINFEHLASPRFLKEWGKSALYFTKPFGTPDAFDAVTCNGATGKILGAFFISQAENAYINQNSADAFEKALQAEDLDVLDLARESIF